jgi:hypothetical protein
MGTEATGSCRKLDHGYHGFHGLGYGGRRHGMCNRAKGGRRAGAERKGLVNQWLRRAGREVIVMNEAGPGSDKLIQKVGEVKFGGIK